MLGGGVQMIKYPSVSLCMIVKNEASCLERCLRSVQGLVDETIIVDTGSTDETVEIAKKYHAVVKNYEWNNDFAKARNYSISFATKEWILVLDADEYLREDDRDLFQSSLLAEEVDSYYIKTLSFTEKGSAQSCVINLNHRLFRRNKGFHYRGAIHEQLVTDEEVNSQISDISFYHTGYLKEVVQAKNKPERNKEILKRLLDADPNNPFHQFNYANELIQLKRYDEAIDYYNQAYQATSPRQGYMTKLMIFRINALLANNQEQEALVAAEEGIKIYPNFTYLMFIKGTIEERLGLITRAMRSYEACLTLGKPDAQFEFASASEGLWPHLKLASIYEGFGDYELAIEHYKQYLMLDSSQYKILYSIASCLHKMGIKPEALAQELEKYTPPTQLNHQILFIDLLMKEQCYEVAQVYLEKSRPLERSSQLIYLYGKNQFYLGNYEVSDAYFKRYAQLDSFLAVERYYYLMYWMTGNEAYGLANLPYSSEFNEIDQYLRGESATISDKEWQAIYYLMEEVLLMPHQELLQTFDGAIRSVLTVSQCLALSQLYLKYAQNERARDCLMKYNEQGGEINGRYIQLINQLGREA